MDLGEHEARRDGLNELDEQAEQAAADAEAQREIYAEGAWLRAAEAGDPGTWAEEDLARQAGVWGPPPPGVVSPQNLTPADAAQRGFSLDTSDHYPDADEVGTSAYRAWLGSEPEAGG